MSQAKNSLQQQGADLERIAQSVGYGLEKVIKGVAGFFGLVLTFEGFKNLVVDAAQAGTTMGRFAESIGKTVETTQAYRQAFTAFTGGETGILQAIRRIKLDMAAVPLAYTNWMVAVGTLTGKDPVGKEPEQVLQDIADAAARRKMSAAQVIMWLRQSLPLTEADILLLSKPGGLQKALEDQRKNVGTPTTPQTQAMEQLQADITNIQTVNSLLELQALTLMEPFLHELLTMTIRIFHWMGGIAKMLGLPSLASPAAATVSPVVAGVGGVLGGGFGGVTTYYKPPSSQTSILATGVGQRTGFNPRTGRFETSTVSGPRSMESGGGSGGITAPTGTPIQHSGMTTITTPSGKTYQVDARYAANFKGFLTDYENAGGTLGSATGTLGFRPSNASGHPIGTAIDINQVDRDIRGGTGHSLPVDTENALAAKWGFVSGANWNRPDTGHFGIRSPEAAEAALQRLGIPSGTSHQSAYDSIRAAAVAAGSSDPDTTAAIAMHESGWLKGGGVFERSGGTNPFGQTGEGPSGYVMGADGQRHAVYPSLLEGVKAHIRRWGSYYGRTPQETLSNMVRGGYNSTDPNWSRAVIEHRIGLGNVPNTMLNMPTGAAAAAQSFDANRPKVENNETSTHVNQVIVHTHATDATGIATDVKDAIGKQLEAPVEAAPP